MSAEETPEQGANPEQPEENSRTVEDGSKGTETLDRILRRTAEFLQKGLLPEAKAQASKAIAARPANALAQNLMAMTLFHQGRLDRAQEIFESLVRRNPEVLTLRINAGLAALHQEDFPCALTHLRAAVDLDSSCARAFGYLALVHLKLGEPDLARAALQEAGLSAQADRVAEATDQQSSAKLGGELAPELERLMRCAPFLDEHPKPHEGFADVAQFSIYQPLPSSGEESFIDQMTSLAEEQDHAEEDIVPQSSHDPSLPPAGPLPTPEEPSPVPEEPSPTPEEPSPTPEEPSSAPPCDPSPSPYPDPLSGSDDLELAMEEAFLQEISSFTSFTEQLHASPPSSLPQEDHGDDAPEPTLPLSTSGDEVSHTEDLTSETTTRPPLESLIKVPLLTKRLEDLALPLSKGAPMIEQHSPLLILRPREAPGGLLVRQAQMILQQGELQWSDAHRVSKGVHAGMLEDQAGRLMRIQGEGLVALYPGIGHQYELVQMADDAIFVPQPCLAGCSAQLRRENGHIPGLRHKGPEIINLRGQGFIALRHQGPLWSCAVTRDAPVHVHLALVLGWTEEIVPQVLDRTSSTQMIGFEGEGVVWLTAGEISGP